MNEVNATSIKSAEFCHKIKLIIMPRLSEELKIKVVILRENGKSWGEVKKLTGVPRSTAQSIVSKYKECGSVKNKKSIGRPTKISDRDARNLIRITGKNRFLSLSQITKEFNKSQSFKSRLCSKTVRKHLKNRGWRKCSAAKVPMIGSKNRAKRNFFCKSMKNFAWERVVFSDEVRFGLQNDGKVCVWRKTGERFNSQCVIQKSNSRQSIMFWGCITKDGAGVLIECSNNMTSNEYIEILNKSLIFALSDFDLVLQHDNAPIHKASNVTSWLNQHNVETLDWPPNSPDLNIIENVWAILKRRLASSSVLCSSIADVKSLVENEWAKITPQMISKLYNSIPKRLQQCEKKKGYATRY